MWYYVFKTIKIGNTYMWTRTNIEKKQPKKEIFKRIRLAEDNLTKSISFWSLVSILVFYYLTR